MRLCILWIHLGNYWEISTKITWTTVKKEKKTSWGMWIIFQRSATINNCLPPQWQKKIKSKKLTSAICQIDLTWLVQVIFINVLECKGITIPHFVLLIYFVTDISFCCTTLNNVLLYDIFLDMKLYVQFSSHQWMFRVLLLITKWPCYFWYAVFVTLNQLCTLCVV